MCKVSISPKLKEELLRAETSEDIDKIFENSKVISKEMRQKLSMIVQKKTNMNGLKKFLLQKNGEISLLERDKNECRKLLPF